MNPAQLQAFLHRRHGQMRANAEAVADFQCELRRWEDDMARKDEALRQRRRERQQQQQQELKQCEGVSKGGDEGEAIRAQGNAHYGRGELEQAVACYTRCLALDDRDLLALSNRAMARLKLGEDAAALADATAALGVDPTHTKSLQRRAAALVRLGRAREALCDLEAALRLHPTDKALQAEVRRVQGLVVEKEQGSRGAAE